MTSEQWILDERRIKFSVLQKLPRRSTLLGLVKTYDMGGCEREAILVLFVDEEHKDIRQAYYCIETGEYLGDKFVL